MMLCLWQYHSLVLANFTVKKKSDIGNPFNQLQFCYRNFADSSVNHIAFESH